MKLLLVFALLCVLAARGHASYWWFSDSNQDEDVFDETAVVDASEDVTQDCLNLAAWGQCAFYDCMEQRFPCGPLGYNQRISKHFCTKIDQNYDSFDTAGRRWLNRTSICLVNYMLPIYRDQDSTTCGSIKAVGIEGVINCNQETTDDGQTFCDFLNSNGDAYKSLMGSQEVSLLVSLRDRRVFQSMISDTLSCSLENFRGFVSSITQSFRSMMGSLWNRIWG